ncbi:ABC transporter substrate-binding protein [Symbiobacterium thermophilum]|uniref:ABC transporter substrate-binding protein n=1 Tax=Symbiobacterium thermophilum TaxID=2734 RepID=UPI000316AB75|nr:ABC transporter substrate-binding protein [Symbiobacterium thermophilum]
MVVLLLAGCSAAREGSEQSGAPPGEVRIGYMPNLTHAQAVLGVAEGTFARHLGVPVRPRLFTSGSAALQALFAGEVDLLYIGPAPALQGYLRSDGDALRVIAGAASGGSVLVLRPDVDRDDLRGTRLATPGIGNSQDAALRYLLMQEGWRTRERGGDVTVSPMAPAEILTLFSRGELDGAWVAEPWGSRLIAEAGGVLAIDERELWPDGTVPTTLVAVRPGFLSEQPEAVRRFLEAHVSLTREIQADPDGSRERVRQALAELQGRPLSDLVMADAWARVDFTFDPMADAVAELADRAFRAGLLGASRPDLTSLYDLTLLQEVAP